MRLYLDLENLTKAIGAPPTGGGAGGASAPPKTPGAATGGSGPQIVDCPLGPNCPDGGHHQMGSTKLQEHTQQAQAQAQSGQMPGDESGGKDVSKPGVSPGSVNLGSVGSDQVKRTPPPVQEKDLSRRDNAVDEWQNWHDSYASARPSLEEHLQNNGFGEEDIAAAHKEEGVARKPIKGQSPSNDTVMDVQTGEAREAGLGTMMSEAGAKGHDENAPDTRQTLSEANIPAKEDARGEGPGSKRKTLIEPTMNADPDRKRQGVPNPMVADEAAVPPDSKPMDHYRLSQVARDSGDEDLAKFHEGMARKRTEGMGSEDHKELANQLHAAGMHDQAAYHEGIHERVNGASPATDKSKIGPNGERFDLKRGTPEHEKETRQRKGEHFGAYRRRLEKEHGIVVEPSTLDNKHPAHADAHRKKKAEVQSKFEAARREHEGADAAEHETAMRDTNHEARSKAENDLKSAKDAHAKLQSKAEELKAKNKEAIDKHAEAQKEYEKAKAEGKKVKPPKKPKLEKEEAVPAKPELSEPETDHEKLQHETHTARAKRIADMAESHLKDNPTLSTSERSRLQRAHQMATYHSNINYTPTAAHKKELGDVEAAVSGMGIKENYADTKAKEDAQVTGAAAKAADQDRQAQEKQQQKQAKVDEKSKAAQSKQQAQDAANQPQPPQTDLDHARVQDHAGKAKKIRESLEAHMAQNPNMSPEDQQKAQHIISELQKHEQMDMVPGKAHVSELKELEKLAGEHGKPPKADGEGGVGGGAIAANPVDTGGNYAMNMIHQGRALGHGLAASATSPTGAAGQLGSQAINYGVSGATQAGHRLLHDAHQNERESMSGGGGGGGSAFASTGAPGEKPPAPQKNAKGPT